MQYTNTINQLILNKILVEDQLDRKTWKNLEAYRLSHENSDDRYDYILRLMKKWPGGTIEEWLTRCPLTWYVESSGQEYLIDYGRHKNSILYQNRSLFVNNPDLAYEYKMFHKPEADHKPTPKAKGGEFVFSNCRAVPKYANQASLDLDLSQIIEATELTLAVYKKIQKDIEKEKSKKTI